MQILKEKYIYGEIKNYYILKELSVELELDINLIICLILIEDKRFFFHNGIDYIRIVGAGISNLKALKIKEGASTLSQQVFDIELQNNSLSYRRERKWLRKIKQTKFALMYEKATSKKEILYYYLVNVYLGNNIFGFKNASNYYFSKSAKFLSYEEIEFLLRRVKRPNDLNF